jgi:hypothetical protein
VGDLLNTILTAVGLFAETNIERRIVERGGYAIKSARLRRAAVAAN